MKQRFLRRAFAMAIALLVSGNLLAQITIDGRVNPDEVGTGADKYELLGAFTATNTGFGDWGMEKLYGAASATKLYLAVVGAVEGGDPRNAFKIYIEVPNKEGIALGTPLPSGQLGEGSAFQLANEILDLEAVYGFAIRGGAPNLTATAVDYTNLVDGKAREVNFGDVPNTGAVVTVPENAAYPLFNGTRMAFNNAANLTAHAAEGGTAAWEIELDMSALGIQASDEITVFAAMTGGNGQFYSGNTIPEITRADITSNFGNSPAFNNNTLYPGVQAVTFSVSTLLATFKPAEELSLKAFPNPFSDQTSISFRVKGGVQPVSISIFNYLGQEVRSLVKDARAAGVYREAFDGRNDTGSRLARGTYIAKIQVGDTYSSQRLVIK
jgi:hypothetical protein